MNFKLVITALLSLLVIVALVVTVQRGREISKPELELPELSNADFDWIAARIFQNEAAGQSRYLTWWGEGEDFPSFGIGHFIWFPTAVEAPFDETFPDMVTFVQQRSPDKLPAPEWLRGLTPFDAPWADKQQFDQARSGADMTALRQWLAATGQLQARFIVASFEQRWQNLALPAKQYQRLTALLQEMAGTAQGLFAVIDYYNFKGLGDNPRERYQLQGWGLIQVLETMPGLRKGEQNLVDLFSRAAARRLSLRVNLSPPERNEARWLDGWLKRLDGYVVNEAPPGAPGGSRFHVQPYLQNPGKDAITLSWFSHDSQPGSVTVWKSAGGDNDSGRQFDSSPVRADALAYHPAEDCDSANCTMPALPYQHEMRITGLDAGTSYRYEVTQNGEQAGGNFQTIPSDARPLRFIVYADSETEPESRGNFAPWPGIDGDTRSRKYPLDQATGYAQNLKVIQQRNPAFVAIAGDLVQSGGEQRDWDEFWSQNSTLAASTFIIPALGNHEYFGGPGALGKYATEDSERAVRKYKTYFDLPGNGSGNEKHAERYYVLNYGAVTLIVLDTNDGQPRRSAGDTNWALAGEADGGVAPDWHPGSEQYRWLVAALRQAQQTSRFTFVMFHGSPWSSGVHGLPPGEGPGRNILSAQPLQALTPLFIEYGVDAVFSGHDEMYEHSVVSGYEQMPGRYQRPHETHFFDIGIGGDGLRGPVENVPNPNQVFLAHTGAPEVYGPDGVLKDGGKHYGHLEVNIEKNSAGQWQAQLDAVYVFPVMDAAGQVVGFERRLYDDSVTLSAH